MALIDKASLLMVPSTYEAGKLYNVLPSGNRAPDSTGENSGYDQTRADFDFDRGSNAAATRIGSDGLIKKYRENLLLQSNQFDTTWVASNGASVTSGQSGYDGSSDAWLLTKSTNNFSNINQSVSASGVNTYSVYAKGASTNFCLRDNVSGTRLEVNLNDGSITLQQSGIIVANVEDVGDGWYRVSATFNEVLSVVQIYPKFNSADVVSVTIQNAQLESGLAATDYLESTSVTGKAGVLIDLPRIDYSSGAGALLLEPQRANLAQYSEYFEGWSHKPNVTATSNYTTSPEGLKNATRLQFTANGYLYNSNAPAQVNGTQYTLSCYAKRNDSGTQSFGFFGNGSGSVDSAMALTNEWKRFDYTYTATNISQLGLAGSSGADVSVYGFQAEASASYPTSYIPNHGESGGVTRAADSMTLSNLQTNNLLGSNQGSFVFHYKPYNAYTGSTGKIFDFRIDANNRVATYFSSGTLRLFSNIAGATNFNQATTLDGDTEFKIALAFDTNSTLVYINGSLEYTLNGFALGLTDFDILPPTNGVKLSECSWYPTKLSGAELETLTTL